MLDSDFWRDLAEQFRRLDPDGILNAVWTLPSGQSSELWEVYGTGDLGHSIRAQFEPLAIRAGLKLDPESRNPVDVWLSALKAYGPQIDLIGPTGVVFQESGFIKRLCQISADFCNVLESHALKAEHTSNAGPEVGPEFEPASVPAEDTVERKPSPTEPEAPPEPDGPPMSSETAGVPEVSPISSEGAPSSAPDVPSQGKHRRKHIDDFLQKCNEICRERLRRHHIWRSVGHATSRQFEYWQRGDPKATPEDDRNFKRVLRMNPEQFIEHLRRKHLLK